MYKKSSMSKCYFPKRKTQRRVDLEHEIKNTTLVIEKEAYKLFGPCKNHNFFFKDFI